MNAAVAKLADHTALSGIVMAIEKLWGTVFEGMEG